MATNRIVRGGPTKAESDRIAPDRKVIRRAVYANDPATASAIREDNRQRYQQEHPPQQRLASGLHHNGTIREVYGDQRTGRRAQRQATYTVSEAAQALGRSLVTLRRWIADGKIPRPFLKEGTRQQRVYSLQEMQIIGGLIAQAEAHGDYLTGTSPAIFQIANQIQGYRLLHGIRE